MIFNKRQVLYGLYHIAEERILGYEMTKNENADFCGEYTYTLSLGSDNEWLHPNPEYVEWTRQFEQKWYNSCFDSPENIYEPEELKVVKVIICREVEEVDIQIPTVTEYFQHKYEKKNPKHWQSLKEDIEKGRVDFYDYYYLENQ